MNTTDLSVVDPLVFCGGRIPGHISSRLMAAYTLDDHTLHLNRVTPGGGRVSWHYVLEHNGTVVFEGSDFSTTGDTSYGEAARDLLGFLTLQPGDTDADFFDSYTPDQLTWRDEYAETLSIFAMEDDQ